MAKIIVYRKVGSYIDYQDMCFVDSRVIITSIHSGSVI